MSGKDSRIQDDCIVKALAKEHGVNEDQVKLVEWSCKPGSNAGDNFATDMILVEGKAEIKDQSLDFTYMIKVTPLQEFRAQMVEQSQVFDKEVLMYSEILPKIAEFRKEKGLRPIQSPKCFFARSNPGILVMENLKKKDFALTKSLEDGMNEEEIKHWLEALAEFHASTYHLLTSYKNGGKDGFLADNPSLKGIRSIGGALEAGFKIGITTMMNDLGAALAEEKDFGPEVANKIKNFAPMAFFKWKEGFYGTCGNFTTIIHGDAWANNAMFKRNESGDNIDLMLIDFQVCRNNSPAYDLAYGLTMCTDGDKRIDNLEKWQRIWYDKFCEDMNAFGYEAKRLYPFEDFLKDYNNFYGMGFVMGRQASQILMKKDEDFDMSQFNEMDSQDAMEKTMDNAAKSAVRQLKVNLPFRQRNFSLLREAIARGFLDDFA